MLSLAAAAGCCSLFLLGLLLILILGSDFVPILGGSIIFLPSSPLLSSPLPYLSILKKISWLLWCQSLLQFLLPLPCAPSGAHPQVSPPFSYCLLLYHLLLLLLLIAASSATDCLRIRVPACMTSVLGSWLQFDDGGISLNYGVFLALVVGA